MKANQTHTNAPGDIELSSAMELTLASGAWHPPDIGRRAVSHRLRRPAGASSGISTAADMQNDTADTTPGVETDTASTAATRENANTGTDSGTPDTADVYRWFGSDGGYNTWKTHDGRGFDSDGVHRGTGTCYGPERFDRDGYNSDGQDRIHHSGTGIADNGFDVDGLQRNGTPHDDNGFGRDGRDRDGYGRDGYNRAGFNRYRRNSELNSR